MAHAHPSKFVVLLTIKVVVNYTLVIVERLAILGTSRELSANLSGNPHGAISAPLYAIIVNFLGAEANVEALDLH